MRPVGKPGPNYQRRLEAAYRGLFHYVDLLLPRLEALLEQAWNPCQTNDTYQELIDWYSVTAHVRGTAYRRVVLGEKVPNADKLFSLFEPDTEWIMCGKAISPIEFSHKVLVFEDAVGFICRWKVLPLGVDERDVLIPEIQRLQAQLQYRIERVSFDRGFHSPENQVELAKLIAHPCLPKRQLDLAKISAKSR